MSSSFARPMLALLLLIPAAISLAPLEARADDGDSSASAPSLVPAPTDPWAPRGRLTFDNQGHAVLSRADVSTVLEPVEFYRLVGRPDLTERAEEQRAAGNGWKLGGVALVVIGASSLLGAGVVALGQDFGDHYFDTSAPSSYYKTRDVFLIVGAAGLGLGMGALIYGSNVSSTEVTSYDERRSLADAYNAHVSRLEAPTNARSLLATLRLSPLVSSTARGGALGISF